MNATTRKRLRAIGGVACCFAAALVAAAARGRAAEDDAAAGGRPDPSVLVHTVPARTGSLAELTDAYGSTAYGVDSVMTLSLQQDGRVIRIAVTPGEVVPAGKMLIEFGGSAQAASSYRQAQTSLALAQAQRAHARQLLAQHLATRDQLAQADKAVTDAQSALQALQREGSDRPQQALRAPFDGVVQTIPVMRGQRVQPATPLVTIAQRDGMMVTVGVEPGQLARVHPGQEVSLQRLLGGAAVAGRVLRLDGQLNARTRLVDVDIALAPGVAASAGLLAGEAMRAEIVVGRPHGWLLPRAAIIMHGAGLALYQVAGSRAVRVPVLLEAERGDQDLVRGALDASRPVVTDGAYQLTDGAAVRLPRAPAAQAEE